MQVATLPRVVPLLVAFATVVACGGAPRLAPARASHGSESTASEAVLLRYRPPVGATLRTEGTFSMLGGLREHMRGRVVSIASSTAITRVDDGVVEAFHVLDRTDDLAPWPPAFTRYFEYRDARHRPATATGGASTRTLDRGAMFPERAVRIGDRWDDEAPLSPSDSHLRYHVFYRLAGLDGEGAARRATILGSAERTREVRGVRETSVYESRSVYDVSTGILLSFAHHIRTRDESGRVGGGDLELTTRIVARP
jgi:hypothetical protein